MNRKYFSTRKAAQQALAKYDPNGFFGLGIYKMQKGTRRAGMYAVCTHIEYLNTY